MSPMFKANEAIFKNSFISYAIPVLVRRLLNIEEVTEEHLRLELSRLQGESCDMRSCIVLVKTFRSVVLPRMNIEREVLWPTVVPHIITLIVQ